MHLDGGSVIRAKREIALKVPAQHDTSDSQIEPFARHKDTFMLFERPFPSSKTNHHILVPRYSRGKVEEMLTRPGFNGRSLLAEAAFRGDRATFEAVLGALQTRLHKQQVILTT